jgi:hypothetical protein
MMMSGPAKYGIAYGLCSLPGRSNFPRKISELPLAYASFGELYCDPEIDFG